MNLIFLMQQEAVHHSDNQQTDDEQCAGSANKTRQEGIAFDIHLQMLVWFHYRPQANQIASNVLKLVCHQFGDTGAAIRSCF